MEALCDLHTHSNHSDGTLSPAQIIEAAQAAGLAAVALTDHNSESGLPEFLEAAGNFDVEAVPGAEFSTDYLDAELHILGLYIRPEHYEAITAMMDDVLRRKERSNRELVQALNHAGYDLDYDTIKNRTPGGFVNRAHIAAELTRLGYTADRKEAFSKLLSPKCGFYQPPRRINAFEMIRVLKSMGAVVVLAHPFLSLKEEDALRAFLGPAVEAGLDGMEVRYPLFDEAQTRAAERLAVEFSLLPSGGSDFHGDNKPDIQLGHGRGGLNVPLDFLSVLKQRRKIE